VGDKYEDWLERALDKCDGDPDCLHNFLDDCQHSKDPEMNWRIYEAFLREVLPRWVEHVLNEKLDEWVEDPARFRDWYERMRQYAEFEEWAEHAYYEVTERIVERVEEVLEENPEARKYFRPYMREALDELLSAKIYAPDITLRELSEITGISVHSYWNTRWWLRRYAEIELGPG